MKKVIYRLDHKEAAPLGWNGYLWNKASLDRHRGIGLQNPENLSIFVPQL